MAQISRRSRQSHGKHFKYGGTYEEIGQLKMGILPVRTQCIITPMLPSTGRVKEMIRQSFMNDETKTKYMANYQDKLTRLEMPAE